MADRIDKASYLMFEKCSELASISGKKNITISDGSEKTLVLFKHIAVSMFIRINI